MDLITNIQTGFLKPLPGELAQLKMAHAFRRKLWPPSPAARDAGVLVLLYPRQNEWHIVLIQRSTRFQNDRHSGQISFPGGKKEPSDRDIIDCAFREAEEEIGLQSEGIKVLGSLTPLYVPVSEFLVHPIVAYCDFTPVFIPQESEVAGVLEVPFEFFIHPEKLGRTDLPLSNQMLIKDVPYFDIHGHIVWGATAMILSELLTLSGHWD
jgi:8-oxo-dGTP pyrophosphatase MutT (NUDIX family)